MRLAYRIEISGPRAPTSGLPSPSFTPKLTREASVATPGKALLRLLEDDDPVTQALALYALGEALVRGIRINDFRVLNLSLSSFISDISF